MAGIPLCLVTISFLFLPQAKLGEELNKSYISPVAGLGFFTEACYVIQQMFFGCFRLS